MDAISSSTANLASAPAGSVQAEAGISMMKKAATLQAAQVATLMEGAAPPALATSGHLGTKVNAFA